MCRPLRQTDNAPADVVAAAARRAPSGGNMQPWNREAHNDSVTVELDPNCTSTMDVAYRASAVPIAAATYNARRRRIASGRTLG
ncbi:hypothetical protein MSAR_21260 [Mycolicibacterium sarraceniae]|uniref:Nitroreductase domain-containing protein n=1 Tax=Mycolicibacterium sarraceniae TaxID=1534348 RepID=A0A7I7SQX2_9MYCO|nr:hypothetical protein MSAR_21260 [Mycolicibacterium sarraceniae]